MTDAHRTHVGAASADRLPAPDQRRSAEAAPTHAHVLLVLPVLQPAGAERIVAELAKRLPAHGFSTSVIALEDEREAIGRELVAAGVPVSGLRLSRRRTWSCARELRSMLPRQRPLIVQSMLFHANIAARVAVAPLVHRDGIVVISGVQVPDRRFRPWQFWLDRWTAPDAAGEVCLSRCVAEFQQRKTGLPASFFPVIYNGVDTDLFIPPAEPRPAGAHVISVGRLNQQKDFPTLLRAWRIVENAMPEAQLSIVGEGPERRRLEGLIAALELRSARLLGFHADVVPLLHQAHVYAQTSAWEGTPLTLVEAMSCGLPSVVTDADTMPEIVDHGRAGLVVPKASPEPLAEAILALLRDPQRARGMGTFARQRAVERFSVREMVAGYAELYRQLLRRLCS